jgi:hypothetical protein
MYTHGKRCQKVRVISAKAHVQIAFKNPFIDDDDDDGDDDDYDNNYNNNKVGNEKLNFEKKLLSSAERT